MRWPISQAQWRADFCSFLIEIKENLLYMVILVDEKLVNPQELFHLLELPILSSEDKFPGMFPLEGTVREGLLVADLIQG